MALSTCHRRLLSAGSLAFLCGCGAIAGLIPNQNLNNPFKLQGAREPLTVSGGKASSTTTASPFNNIGSLPVNPHVMLVFQSLGADAALSKDANPPDKITLTNLSLEVTLTDANGATASLPPSVIPGPIVYTKSGANGYVISGTPPSFPTIDTGDQTGQILGILTGGGTNTVTTTMSATVTSAPPLPDGAVFSLTLGAESGRVEF